MRQTNFCLKPPLPLRHLPDRLLKARKMFTNSVPQDAIVNALLFVAQEVSDGGYLLPMNIWIVRFHLGRDLSASL